MKSYLNPDQCEGESCINCEVHRVEQTGMSEARKSKAATASGFHRRVINLCVKTSISTLLNFFFCVLLHCRVEVCCKSRPRFPHAIDFLAQRTKREETERAASLLFQVGVGSGWRFLLSDGIVSSFSFALFS